jgi:serine/threonine-protein kinase
MAFEQVTAGPLSPATDVWALGLIAYFILTGRRYWRSADQQGSALQALFAEILTLPIEKPSVRLQQQGCGIALPAGFDGWLLRCLERDPGRRFRSAGMAIDEFARVFDRAPRKSSRPAPRLAPLHGASATQTFQELPRAREPQPSTAASLPAVVKERNGTPLRASRARSRGLLAVAGVAGVALAGALAWSLARDTPSVPAAAEANRAIEAIAPAATSKSVPVPQRAETGSPRVQIALPSGADEPPAPVEAVRVGDTKPQTPEVSDGSRIKVVKVEDAPGVPSPDPSRPKTVPVLRSALVQSAPVQSGPARTAPVRTEPVAVPADKPRPVPVPLPAPEPPKAKPSAYDVR